MLERYNHALAGAFVWVNTHTFPTFRKTQNIQARKLLGKVGKLGTIISRIKTKGDTLLERGESKRKSGRFVPSEFKSLFKCITLVRRNNVILGTFQRPHCLNHPLQLQQVLLLLLLQQLLLLPQLLNDPEGELSTEDRS